MDVDIKKTCPCNIHRCFKDAKIESFLQINFDIFLNFAQNIDYGYMLPTSTHNLCFRAKIRKIGILCKPQFCFIKVGYKGVYISRTCFPDERKQVSSVLTDMLTKIIHIVVSQWLSMYFEGCCLTISYIYINWSGPLLQMCEIGIILFALLLLRASLRLTETLEVENDYFP